MSRPPDPLNGREVSPLRAADEDSAVPAGGSAPAQRGNASPLTARQREVAALVAEGLTDREIAAWAAAGASG